VRRPRTLEGEVRPPGDKSISHRALILGAIASGQSRLRGLSTGADVASTARCVGALGAILDGSGLNGCGMHGLHQAAGVLDCGNSGTTMRLLAGLLAAQEFASELAGDESLQRRPMDRVVAPLIEMGAHAEWPPLRVGGRLPLRGIDYAQLVASAQVKSAILLAGLFANGTTTVIEPLPTRNHTELMLRAMGADVRVEGLRVSVGATEGVAPLDIDIPGDFSAAAFWLVAGGLIPDSHVRVQGVGVNPTRTALVNVLRASGFQIAFSNERTAGGEPVAEIDVRPAEHLRPFEVTGSLSAELIDELPVLAVAATQVPGRSLFADAAELRVKESDRIAAMAKGLATMGADITAEDDGWTIRGRRDLEGARVSSRGDHRVAMALAIAGLLADGVTEIEDAECVEISYPGFFDQLESLC
jgi:3-phosphoshikimate 1-carboxyvinyltransferase